jgi:5'-nucleotidase
MKRQPQAINSRDSNPLHILITNDDGISAPGLLALAQSLRRMGKVSVLAPDHNWSATGHVRTLDRPLRVRDVNLADGSLGWTTDGSPADCVALGGCEFLDTPVDMVVSGINSGANVGHDMTYSGTVAAAMEAAIWGIPAVAISLDAPGHAQGADYLPAAEVSFRVVQAAIRRGIPTGTLLNVNVPFLPLEAIKGIRATRQGLRVYHDRLEGRVDPRGRPYYWTIGEPPTGIPEGGTDIGALAEGYVSITPVQLDLTAYDLITSLTTWDWQTSQALLVPQNEAILVSG